MYHSASYVIKQRANNGLKGLTVVFQPDKPAINPKILLLNRGELEWGGEQV